MTPLEAAIAAIEAKIAEARTKYKDAEAELEALNREIDTWESALEILRSQAAPTPPPARAERMDIAQAVLRQLADGGQHTVAELADTLSRKPSQIEAAINRLGDRVVQDGDGTLYRVPETP